jgi:hypothetical protein
MLIRELLQLADNIHTILMPQPEESAQGTPSKGKQPADPISSIFRRK